MNKRIHFKIITNISNNTEKKAELTYSTNKVRNKIAFQRKQNK